jgi:hypothetical protein
MILNRSSALTAKVCMTKLAAISEDWRFMTVSNKLASVKFQDILDSKTSHRSCNVMTASTATVMKSN